MSKHYWDIWMW